MKPEQLEFPEGRALLNSDGSEVLDSRPLALPIGFERPESIQETIRRLVTDRSIQADLAASGAESFEEADDFEVDDDLPIDSPYEENFDPGHVITREQEVRAGAVRPLTPEEIKAASDAVVALRANSKVAEPPKKAEPPEVAK